MNWVPLIFLLLLIAFTIALVRSVRERRSIVTRVTRDLAGHNVINLPADWDGRRVIVIQLDDDEEG